MTDPLHFAHLGIVEGQVLSVSVGDAPVVPDLHRSLVDDPEETLKTWPSSIHRQRSRQRLCRIS